MSDVSILLYSILFSICLIAEKQHAFHTRMHRRIRCIYLVSVFFHSWWRKRDMLLIGHASKLLSHTSIVKINAYCSSFLPIFSPTSDTFFIYVMRANISCTFSICPVPFGCEWSWLSITFPLSLFSFICLVYPRVLPSFNLLNPAALNNK